MPNLNKVIKQLQENAQRRKKLEDAMYQYWERLDQLAKKHKKKYTHQKERNILLKDEKYETTAGPKHSKTYGDAFGYTGQIVSDLSEKIITMIRLNKPNGDETSALTITPYFLDDKDAIEEPDRQQRILRRIRKWIAKRGAYLEEMYENYRQTYHGINLPLSEVPLTPEEVENLRAERLLAKAEATKSTDTTLAQNTAVSISKIREEHLSRK